MMLPYAALPVGSALMLLQIALSWFSGFEPDRAENDSKPLSSTKERV
jgi:TRAP-type C4-dicarboxylate transport system permease small subunit